MLTLAERHTVLHTRAIVRAGFSERVSRDIIQYLIKVAAREGVTMTSAQRQRAVEMGYDVTGIKIKG